MVQEDDMQHEILFFSMYDLYNHQKNLSISQHMRWDILLI